MKVKTLNELVAYSNKVLDIKTLQEFDATPNRKYTSAIITKMIYDMGCEKNKNAKLFLARIQA